MRYVIIGDSCSVGTVTLSLLRGKGGEFVQQDVTEELPFPFFSDDVVVHLAVNQYYHRVPRKNRREFFESVNVDGTENVLKKMEAVGAQHRMVFLGTGKPQTLSIGTQHLQKPFEYYGKRKKVSEALCEHYRDKGLNITVFRPRMIIGKRRMEILMKFLELIEHSLPVSMIGSIPRKSKKPETR